MLDSYNVCLQETIQKPILHDRHTRTGVLKIREKEKKKILTFTAVGVCAYEVDSPEPRKASIARFASNAGQAAALQTDRITRPVNRTCHERGAPSKSNKENQLSPFIYSGAR